LKYTFVPPSPIKVQLSARSIVMPALQADEY
jgi:hypothetical protein